MDYTHQLLAVSPNRDPGATAPSLVDLLEARVAASPDCLAIVESNRHLSYRDLDERANALAHRLRAAGVEAGMLVAIMVPRSIEMIVAVIGILKAGAGYVPLDAGYPKERLSFILEDSDARFLVSHRLFADTLPSHAPAAIFIEDSPAGGASALIDRCGDAAYLIYTSGSTGKPKGVLMPHRPLVKLIEWQRSILGDAARTLQFAPLGFDVSFQEIFSTFDTGGTLILVDEQTRLDSGALWNFIRLNEVERLFLPFVALQQLAEVVDGPTPLRDVVTAGEQLRITPQIRRMFDTLSGCRLHNHYGPSETHVVTALTLTGAPASWPALPPIGYPIPSAEITLIGADSEPGNEGELWVGGDCLCTGYWQRDELNAQKFPVRDGQRFYRTGDLGRRLTSGALEFLGRSDDQAKVRGFRVEPGEIENVLSEFSGLRASAVVVRPDSHGDNRLWAFMVPEKPFTVSQVRDFARGKLPDYLVPSYFIFIDELPKTPSGKIDRRSLPDIKPVAEINPTRFGSETEIKIAQVWSEVLESNEFGADDNFFDAGGDSLRLTRAHARIQDLFGEQIPLARLFEHPTIRTLAASLGTEQQKSTAARINDRALRQRQALMNQRKNFR